MSFSTLFPPRSGNPFLIKACRLAFLMVLIGTLFTGCTKREETFARLSDLEGGKLFAVPSGTVADKLVLTRFPKAKFSYYNSIHDCALAVLEGKADACSYDKPVLQNLAAKMKGLVVMDELIMDDQYGFAVKQSNAALKRGIDETLNQLKSDGTYAAMQQRWFPKTGEPGPMPEFPTVATNDVLRFGTAAVTEPMAYVGANQQVIGFDVEFAAHIARRLGKRLEVINMEFGALIPALLAGKVDVIGAGMSITEERAKSVLFSASYYPSGIAVMVKAPAITNTLSSLDDIADKTIGVLSGTIHDAYVREHYPQATVKQFAQSPDLFLALQTHKVDAVMTTLSALKVVIKENPDIAILKDTVFSMPLGVGFNKKNQGLRTRFNAFLKAINTDGTMEDMLKRWFEGDPLKAKMPTFAQPETGKSLRAAVSVNDLPYVSFANGTFVGFDVELLQRFAHSEGCGLDLQVIDFHGLIMALSGGKVDLIADGIAITDERKQSIDFSDPYAYFPTSVAVRSADMAGFSGDKDVLRRPSLLKRFAESVTNNLLLEDRYKLIFDGLLVTLLISLFSALFGTLLGGLVCFLRMSKHRFWSGTAKTYIALLRGTPVLVLLMIIFYVVFASVNINPVVVAVIAFGLNFAAYVSEMFRTSIESVDKGQFEAGIAGGFTKVGTFIHIIFPQALRRVLPVYKGEFISLVKMTSIVGYIAVQDVTRASDIIRSRTFDAFFPLLLATVIYLLLAWLLTWLLDRVEISVDPRQRRARTQKNTVRFNKQTR